MVCDCVSYDRMMNLLRRSVYGLYIGWQKLRASDGKVYYQNKRTKEIQWEKPIAKGGDGAEGGGTGGGGGTSGDHFE